MLKKFNILHTRVVLLCLLTVYLFLCHVSNIYYLIYINQNFDLSNKFQKPDLIMPDLHKVYECRFISLCVDHSFIS